MISERMCARSMLNYLSYSCAIQHSLMLQLQGTRLQYNQKQVKQQQQQQYTSPERRQYRQCHKRQVGERHPAADDTRSHDGCENYGPNPFGGIVVVAQVRQCVVPCDVGHRHHEAPENQIAVMLLLQREAFGSIAVPQVHKGAGDERLQCSKQHGPIQAALPGGRGSGSGGLGSSHEDEVKRLSKNAAVDQKDKSVGGQQRCAATGLALATPEARCHLLPVRINQILCKHVARRIVGRYPPEEVSTQFSNSGGVAMRLHSQGLGQRV